MYASSHLALLVLTSTARSNLDKFYDIRWWVEDPYPLGNAFWMAISPSILCCWRSMFTVSEKFTTIWRWQNSIVVLFGPLPFSWAIHMVFNRFLISELFLSWSLWPGLLYLNLTLHPPTSPLYDIPCRLRPPPRICHHAIRERSISAHLGPPNPCAWG